MTGGELLKLSAYFGERERWHGRFLTDVIAERLAAHGVATSLVLRGAEGFGVRHHVRDDRRLTLSEDLPLVVYAVDVPERVEPTLADLRRLAFDGLITLERARTPPLTDERAAKVSVHIERHARIGRAPAHEAIVGLMREAGMRAAVVLLGLDGTFAGRRARARLFAANRGVPTMVVGIGPADAARQSLERIGPLAEPALITVERVELVPGEGPSAALVPPEPGWWGKLTVYSHEGARHAGRPQHSGLIRGLVDHDSRGATSIRAVWGYNGDRAPRGDALLALRRDVPIVTEIVDAPERLGELLTVARDIADGDAELTVEWVPAHLSRGPGIAFGEAALDGPAE